MNIVSLREARQFQNAAEHNLTDPFWIIATLSSSQLL
jgi:hypothetical protein